ncbi:MAG: O-antigen ligase family protein [Candidatus Doudnabacteria bacterium]|nr:O-antigen ligase family protein [Candidatus Doudnabacteria bacterium]
MAYLFLLTLLLAPTYAIRFKLGGLPANLLMIWVFLFWLIFFFYLLAGKNIKSFFSSPINKSVLIGTGLFFISGLVSLFVKGLSREKIGQFIVLFLQPISLFFIGNYLLQKFPNLKKYLLSAIYFALAAAGLLAIIQYFSLWSLPMAFWGNSNEPKRAVSFFVHPNFYALWCAPLLAFVLPEALSNFKLKISRLQSTDAPADGGQVNLKLLAWGLGLIGLILSLSRAGWLGFGFATLVYLIVAADKNIRKIAGVIAVVLVVIIISVPNLRWRFTLPFYGEKSAVSRLSLWQTGIKGIKESPVFGLGLTGFSRNWERLNTDKGLTDAHNFPHNIFLDLWVETGLLGLISFTSLCFYLIYFGIKNRANLLKLGVSLFLIALIFQGMVDNPYFKNDLALVFWTILAFAI